jgi:hypothetical protein
MQIHLKVDLERLTLDDVIALEEGQLKTSQMRDLLARFVVDSGGNYLPEAEAQKQLGRLNVAQVKQVAEAFAEQLREQQDTAVPPASAAS